ncbi:MAG: aminoacyl-tRNA hydrolase [Ignavibacteria bacterium RBG_16_36_9]|nr:MAG: aminoacyl-tRNA hydrolase [Ignavibacteria bacterium RBG_16_36_9]
MRVIFGIGNPGIRYEFTRHNAGFLLLDYFAQKNSLCFKETIGEYLEAPGKISDQNFVLIKPVTYVNNSGIAARQVFDKYNAAPEDFLVVSDDTNLKNYILRVRLSGGDGGHNGLSSIIYHLMTDQFPRIRIGIGSNPSDVSLSDYVLSEFSKNELEEYQNTFSKGSQLIEEFIFGGSKKMLEANSILMKSENPNNPNTNI